MSLRMSEEEYADYLKKHNPRMTQAEINEALHPLQKGPRLPYYLQAPPAPRGTSSLDGAARTSSVSGKAGATFPIGEGYGKAKRQKYGNRRVEIDGMKFDSQHEADYYFGMLLPRVKAGELKCVCRQVPFDLPGGIRYIADFVTMRPDMSIEAVIDAKSEATRKNQVYINKKKQVKACWGIEILEV